MKKIAILVNFLLILYLQNQFILLAAVVEVEHSSLVVGVAADSSSEIKDRGVHNQLNSVAKDSEEERTVIVERRGAGSGRGGGYGGGRGRGRGRGGRGVPTFIGGGTSYHHYNGHHHHNSSNSVIGLLSLFTLVFALVVTVSSLNLLIIL